MRGGGGPSTGAGAGAQVLSDPSRFDVAVTTYDMMLSARLGSALARSITWRCTPSPKAEEKPYLGSEGSPDDWLHKRRSIAASSSRGKANTS